MVQVLGGFEQGFLLQGMVASVVSIVVKLNILGRKFIMVFICSVSVFAMTKKWYL